MSEENVFYICTKCFRICEDPQEKHEHDQKLVKCEPLKLTEIQRKPLYDSKGRLLTRAPRWFLEEIGLIKPLVD